MGIVLITMILRSTAGFQFCRIELVQKLKKFSPRVVIFFHHYADETQKVENLSHTNKKDRNIYLLLIQQFKLTQNVSFHPVTYKV